MAKYGGEARSRQAGGRATQLDYHKKLRDLLLGCKRQGIKVSFVGSSKLRDYWGMNGPAAKAIGYPLGRNAIHIRKGLSYRNKYVTLKHELAEMDLMRTGKSYWGAHIKAFGAERE